MINAIILDFVGVVADINYIQLGLSLPLSHKISALRAYANLKKHNNLKQSFNQYQKGNINLIELKQEFNKHCPNSTYAISEILNNLKHFTNINNRVLASILNLKLLGIKTVLMSNSIPETENIIIENNLQNVFDKIILSNQMGLKKPEAEIYEYAINTFNLNPNTTLMIDDTKKNLTAAEQFGIRTKQCKNTKEVEKVLEQLIKILNKNDICTTHLNE